MRRQLDPARLGDHIDRLYRAAWAMCGSREDAEDLVQDTFAQVLARPRFLRREDDASYLLRALRNRYVSSRRAAARRPVSADRGPGWEPPDTRPERSPEAALEAAEVFEAIAALAPDYRDVIVAVDVMGLSYRDAARALGAKEGTIMSRLYRARGQIARGLDGEAGAS